MANGMASLQRTERNLERNQSVFLRGRLGVFAGALIFAISTLGSAGATKADTLSKDLRTGIEACLSQDEIRLPPPQQIDRLATAFSDRDWRRIDKSKTLTFLHFLSERPTQINGIPIRSTQFTNTDIPGDERPLVVGELLYLDFPQVQLTNCEVHVSIRFVDALTDAVSSLDLGQPARELESGESERIDWVVAGGPGKVFSYKLSKIYEQKDGAALLGYNVRKVATFSVTREVAE